MKMVVMFIEPFNTFLGCQNRQEPCDLLEAAVR